MESVKELLRKKRFWLAAAAVAAVAINHFVGLDETQTLDVLGAVIAALLGASAGVSAGKEAA